jgi:UDP-glucose 4-epimerase
MKRILITGADSYIGTSVEQWVKTYPDQYAVDTIDLRDGSWKKKSFIEYDVIFHVAGIVHVDVKNINENIKALYFKVNRDLTIEIAQKAKNEGVKQFIFMSSMSVYGEDRKNKERIITKDTIPTPSDFYGISKYQAEKGILSLESKEFNVLIIRPPMIYGKNSKGNYPRLSKLAQKIPLFPNIENKRSMLHIDNFCEFIRVIIDKNEKGYFFPQNKEYVKTSEMVKFIAEVHGRKLKLTRIFNGPLKLLISKVTIINKVFGDLVYEKSMSNYEFSYQIRSFKESIELTEVRVLNE